MNSINRCLITGASGFIGLPLCKELKTQGYFVRALLRNKNKNENNFDEICYHDFEQKETPISSSIMENIDTVFHLAGIAHAQDKTISKDKYWQVNVKTTEMLMHLAHQSGVKQFIYFSSIKAMNNPSDFYGASKKEAEEKVLALGKKYNLHVCILRPALVYGIGVKGNLHLMISGIKSGLFPNLPETNNKRSLVSVDDLISAAINVAKNPRANNKIYTITDGLEYSTHKLCAAIRSALNLAPMSYTIPYIFFKCGAKFGDLLSFLLRSDIPFNSDTLEKVFGSAYFSNHEIKVDLGWSPKDNFYDQIKNIVAN